MKARRKATPDRKTGFGSALLVVALMLGAVTFIGVSPASATTYSSGSSLIAGGASNFGNNCWWVSSEGKNPSIDGTHLVDLNGYLGKTQFSSGCSDSYLLFKAWLYQEVYLGDVILYDYDNGTMCTNTGSQGWPPSGYTGLWAYGKPYSPAGACSGNNHWWVYAQAILNSFAFQTGSASVWFNT